MICAICWAGKMSKGAQHAPATIGACRTSREEVMTLGSNSLFAQRYPDRLPAALRGDVAAALVA